MLFNLSTHNGTSRYVLACMPLYMVTFLLFVVSVLHCPFYKPHQLHCVLDRFPLCVDLRFVPVTFDFKMCLSLIFEGLL